MKSKHMNTNMSELLYSPPYMPLDDEACLIWVILLHVGYKNVKILKYEPKKRVVFSGWKEEKEVMEEIDLSWAFRPYDENKILELVRKVFAEFNNQKL